MATIQSMPAVTYITVAIVKERTSIAAFKDDLSKEEITTLIEHAEETVDAYVGRQRHHTDDTNTDRVFPRVEDVSDANVVIIPAAITQATLRQVEWLYKEWWSVHLEEPRTIEYEAKKVTIGGDGSYSEDRGGVSSGGGSGIDFSAASLAPQAKALLQPYRCRSAELATEDIVPRVQPLSSRDVLIQS